MVMYKLIKVFKLEYNYHYTSKHLNNFIEKDHRHIKVKKTRYQSISTVKNTIKEIACIYGLYKKNRRPLQIYEFSSCHKISYMLYVKVITYIELILIYILTLQQNHVQCKSVHTNKNSFNLLLYFEV